MVEIELQDGYFIEVDPLNYTLRQKYSGKTKDGEEKESVRTHGYYGSIRQAVDRYIILSQLDFMDGMSIDLKEYVDLIERLNKSAVQRIESAIGGDRYCEREHGRLHMARRAVQFLSGRCREENR